MAEATAARVTLEGGAQFANPIRTAARPEFGDGVDVCLVWGAAPPDGPAVAVDPAAELAGLSAPAPTVVWVPLAARVPARSELERLRLAEADAALTGSAAGEFRALLQRGGRWEAAATCTLRPGRMADVRVFAPARPLGELLPPGLPPDCEGPDVPATLRVTSLSGHETVSVGTVEGLRGATVHGSERASWRLECPQSGDRTLEVLGPVRLGAPRSVVQVPQRCDVPPCISSRDVAGGGGRRSPK